MKHNLSLMIFLSVIISLASCSGSGSRHTVEDDIEVIVVDGTAGNNTDVVTTSGWDDGEDFTSNNAFNVNSIEYAELLEERVVYFNYNSSELTAEGKAIAQAHAQYIANNPNVTVVLEGHTDERGTREYNLALAEKRAESVKNYMQTFGINGNNIEVISYGEERPAVYGNDEAAWSLNRRVDILYQ